MSLIITVANQKGGVGKSTTVHAFGKALEKMGKRILFVDLDSQANLSYTFAADGDRPGTYELLMRRTKAEDCIQKNSHGEIIAASSLLSGADMELNFTGKEYRLKEALGSIKASYDYIVMDTPPALGILTVNALTLSDYLVIPAQADVYSLQGIGQLFSTVEAVRTYCNPGLKISGILLTRFNNRTILSRDLSELIASTAKELGSSVYSCEIRECISLKEAQASRADIFAYAPKSNAAADYSAFAKEFLAKLA
jgi:chromosome partitioning protein